MLARFNLAALIKRGGTTRRKTLKLPVITPTAAQASDLAKIYIGVLREMALKARGLMTLYREALANDTRAIADAALADDANDMKSEMDRWGDYFSRLVLTITPDISDWALKLERWHEARWGAALTPSGVTAQTLIGPEDVQQSLDLVVARNVALVRNVSDEARGRISDIVFRGFQARIPAREVARELDDALQLGRARSLRIAADQASKLSAELDTERMRQAGIEEWIWRHSAKAHPRPEHLARDGNIYTWDNAPSDLPGMLPYCFPSGQPVGFHDDVLMAWRRLHRGEATEIVADEGVTLRCTPNHPILTMTGWKAAQDIKVGDHVIDAGSYSVQPAKPDVEQRQARIGDIFAAAQAVFGSVSSNGRGGEFHGDATVDEQIDIVDADNGLRHHVIASGAKDVGQFVLEHSAVPLALAHRFSAPDLLGVAGPAATAGIVRCLDLLEPLLWRQLSPDDAAGLALVTDLHAGFAETRDERWSRHTQTVRQRLSRLAGLIGPDRFRAIEVLSATAAASVYPRIQSPSAELLGQCVAVEPHLLNETGDRLAGTYPTSYRVESVVTERWTGHVFNLETASGWYAAGSVAVKNCGCKKQAIVRTG